MLGIYFDPYFKNHDTGSHPESVSRVLAVQRAIEGIKSRDQQVVVFAQDDWHVDPLPYICAVHQSAMIERIRDLCARGGGYLDPDTVVSPQSFDVAKAACQAGLEAVNYSLSRTKPAVALMRPPGHHANSCVSMGFCLFNNVAIAAHYLKIYHAVQRILIIDWDVHHGNGTQDIFYEDESVFYLSIHRYPFYPGTGHADERGTGKGYEKNLNIPIAWGTPVQQYHQLFRAGLEKAVARHKPEVILISAGFDAHKDDPIGSLGLDDRDFYLLTQEVVQQSQSNCAGRVISFLEGGYHLRALEKSLVQHFQAFLDHAAD